MLPIIALKADACGDGEGAASFAGACVPGTGGTVGVTAPAVEPGIGIAKGFQMRCMNAIASCAENGGVALASALVDSFVMHPPRARRAHSGIGTVR
jgi:hypothetical protein